MTQTATKPGQWAKVLAEQLVVSLTGLGGKLNTHEQNVEWTAAMISLHAEDPAALRDLAEAAKACDVAMETAAIHNVYQILPPAYRESWAAAHMALTAALAKVQP